MEDKLQTEKEFQLKSEISYLKYWVVLPLILIIIYLIFSIMSSPKPSPCEGMTQEECEAYEEVMGSNPAFR